MTRQAEIDYFGNMSEEGREFARNKPFSADQRGGYLVDIDNNISFKEISYSEQSTPSTDFTIVEMMTKKLFKSYLNSNSQLGTKY